MPLFSLKIYQHCHQYWNAPYDHLAVYILAKRLWQMVSRSAVSKGWHFHKVLIR